MTKVPPHPIQCETPPVDKAMDVVHEIDKLVQHEGANFLSPMTLEQKAAIINQALQSEREIADGSAEALENYQKLRQALAAYAAHKGE